MTRYTVLIVLLLALLPSLVRSEPLSAEEYTRVVAQLQDTDAKARIAAVKRLGEAYGRKAVASLLPLRQDADSGVRLAVITALTQTDVNVRADLQVLFTDADIAVRVAAIRAIGQFNKMPMDTFAPLLTDKEARVRAAAAYGLGHTYDLRVLEPLRVLLEDDSPEVRASAAYALGQLTQLRQWVNDCPENYLTLLSLRYLDAATRDRIQAILQQVGWEKTKDALATLLDDKDPATRAAGILTLQKFHDPRAQPLLIEGLKNADPVHRAELFHEFAFYLDRNGNEPAQAKMIDAALALLKEETDVHVLEELVCMLGRYHDPRAADPLIEAMPGKDPMVLSQIIQALEWTRSPRNGQVILPYLADKSPAVRRAAAYALGVLHEQQAVEPLLQMLHDENKDVREAVLAGLGGLKDSRMVKPLLALLADPAYADCRMSVIAALGQNDDASMIDPLLQFKDDPYLRGTVCRALANCDDPRVTQLVLAALHDADSFMQNTAKDVVWQLTGESMVAVMAVLLRDTDANTRKRACDKLVASKSPSAGDALMAALQDADAGVRKLAATGLGTMAEKRAMPGLQALAKDDPENTVRAAAAQALVQLGADKLAMFPIILKGDNAENKTWIINHLGQANDPKMTDALLAVLADADAGVRAAAIQQLDPSREPRVMEPLLAKLKDPDAHVRDAVAYRLYNVRDSRAVDALIAACKDPDALVRYTVASALGLSNEPRTLAPLLALLQDENASIRLDAANALVNRHCDDARIASTLIALLKEKKGQERISVLRNLSEAGGAQAGEVLLGYVNDKDANIRALAIQGLHSFNDPRAIDALCVALKDADNNVSHSAVYALGESTDPRAAAELFAQFKEQMKDEHDLLDFARINCTRTPSGFILRGNFRIIINGQLFNPDEPMPAAIRTALQKQENRLTGPALDLLKDPQPLTRALGAAALVNVFDPCAMPGLTAALQDDDALVRRLAVRGLRTLGDLRSLTPLCTALRDPNAAVRAEAALALGEVQDTRAMPPLLALLKDPQADVRFAAVWALGQIADQEATQPLIALYPDADPGTRAQICYALGRIRDPRAGDFLLAMLHYGTPWLRACAMQALGASKEKRAVEPLIAVLNKTTPDLARRPDDPGEIVDIRNLAYPPQSRMAVTLAPEGDERIAAAAALSAIGDPRAVTPLLNLLTERDIDLAKAAIMALGNFPDARAATALIDQLKEERRDRPWSAIYALSHGAVSEIACAPLLTALKDANPRLRQHALEAMMRMDERLIRRREVVDALLALPVDAVEEQHRASLISSLGKTGDPRAVAPLVAHLQGTDPNFSREADYALCRLHLPESVPVLCALLKRPWVELRKRVLELLANLQFAEAAPALAPLLADADAGVRWRAAVALCRCGDKRGAAPLLSLLRQGDNAQPGKELPERWRICQALARVGGPEVTDALLALSPGDDRSSALWQLKSPKAMHALLDTMQQETVTPPEGYSPTLVNVLHAIDAQYSYTPAPDPVAAQLADPRIIAHCTRLLQLAVNPHWQWYTGPATNGKLVSPPGTLREAVVHGLAKSGSPLAVPPLIAALETGTLNERKEAAIALGNLHDKRAIAPLTAALHHIGADARPAVEEALKEVKK